MNWQPIETAPKDGRPIWAKGNNFGQEKHGQHCCWAWWDVDGWKSADAPDQQSTFLYLVEWMPLHHLPVSNEAAASRAEPGPK